MKQLLISAAVAMAISAPVFAQPAPSAPGAGMPAATGMPVQPLNRMPAGGRPTSERGLTGAAAGSAVTAPSAGMPAASAGHPVQSMNRMPAGGRATSERGSAARAHHRRHAVQSAKGSAADNSANQLNRQELSQLQGGNPTTMNRMPAGGRATSGGPTQ